MARVLIPLADGFEELEAVTVIDLLRRARITVDVAGLAEGPVTGSRKTVVMPDISLDHALSQDYDMMVLPGGLPGATHLDEDPRIHQLLHNLTERGKYTAAICAAPKVLAHAGLLNGKRVTCFPGTLDNEQDKNINIDNSGAVVRDGQVITSRGPGTTIDFALELIALLTNTHTSAQVEEGLKRPPAHLVHHNP
ncbi:MAG TPA: DJ-1/PfpI family protein [Acidiferrobacteraceae bacterium]|nr:DJ-1/PfpI family protein [Acidiferrobacteraceae bacterium]